MNYNCIVIATNSSIHICFNIFLTLNIICNQPHRSYVHIEYVFHPVFNDEKRIARCIQSVKNQKHINLELIIIDDGSDDTSAQIADLYASTDRRIKVIKSKNRGPAAARNIGIRSSIGEFIFFLDSDDYLIQNTLEYLLDKIKIPNVDLCIGDFLISNNLINDVKIKSKHTLKFSKVKNKKFITQQSIQRLSYKNSMLYSPILLTKFILKILLTYGQELHRTLGLMQAIGL